MHKFKYKVNDIILLNNYNIAYNLKIVRCQDDDIHNPSSIPGVGYGESYYEIKNLNNSTVVNRFIDARFLEKKSELDIKYLRKEKIKKLYDL